MLEQQVYCEHPSTDILTLSHPIPQGKNFEPVTLSRKFYLSTRLGKLRGWKAPADPDEPPDIPEFDREFNHLRAAKAWGLTPAQWRAQSVEDRGQMLALTMMESTIELRRMTWREARRKREMERDKNGESGRGMVNAMNRRLKDGNPN